MSYSIASEPDTSAMVTTWRVPTQFEISRGKWVSLENRAPVVRGLYSRVGALQESQPEIIPSTSLRPCCKGAAPGFRMDAFNVARGVRWDESFSVCQKSFSSILAPLFVIDLAQ